MEKNKASQIMIQGFTCAESVLMAVCEDNGIENEMIPHIAMCFGGGMGNTGATCGAFTGAVMALGVVDGPAGNEKEVAQSMAKIQELRRLFEEKMGTISCRELTGVDLTKPEELKEFMESGTPQKICLPVVDLAYNLATQLLKEEQ